MIVSLLFKWPHNVLNSHNVQQNVELLTTVISLLTLAVSSITGYTGIEISDAM